MSLLIIGISYRTAPVAVREQLAFDEQGVAAALACFRQRYPQAEVAILSTCNRMEILVAGEEGTPGAKQIIQLLAEAHDLPAAMFAPYLYQFTDEEACRHFFQVVAGIDSMVLGEYQIVHQAKQAYNLARQQQTTGRTLNRLFHHAFEVSKRIHSETEIGSGKLSISSIAADLVSQQAGGKPTLVVGAGRMARLVCRHLIDGKYPGRITVTSRTMEHADNLAADCHVTAAPLNRLDEQLRDADCVILAINCTEPMLTVPRLEQAMANRAGRPLLLVDICVPRSVATDVARIPGVTLYDIDAIGELVTETRQSRVAALSQCERILDEEVAAFAQWMSESCFAPLIEQIYTDARRIRDAELEKFLAACGEMSEGQRQAVTQLMDRLVGKFMHPCVMGLRHGRIPALQTAANTIHAQAARCVHSGKEG